MVIFLTHTAQSSWLNQISKSFDGSKPWERAAAGQTNLLNVKQHQSPPPDIQPFYISDRSTQISQILIQILYQIAQSYATLLATQLIGSFDKTSVAFVPIWFQLCRVILLLCNHWFGSCDAFKFTYMTNEFAQYVEVVKGAK